MEQLQKNATIGPLAGIEPGALRFLCSALFLPARVATAPEWTIPQLTKILNSTSLDKNFITA
jgi:hypothetical protein